MRRSWMQRRMVKDSGRKRSRRASRPSGGDVNVCVCCDMLVMLVMLVMIRGLTDSFTDGRAAGSEVERGGYDVRRNGRSDLREGFTV